MTRFLTLKLWLNIYTPTIGRETMAKTISYSEALLGAHRYLLSNYPEVFFIGQGLWSPWYVGNTMTDLEADFGRKRIIDTPVSESACTGAGAGSFTHGYESRSGPSQNGLRHVCHGRNS